MLVGGAAGGSVTFRSNGSVSHGPSYYVVRHANRLFTNGCNW